MVHRYVAPRKTPAEGANAAFRPAERGPVYLEFSRQGAKEGKDPCAVPFSSPVVLCVLAALRDARPSVLPFLRSAGAAPLVTRGGSDVPAPRHLRPQAPCAMAASTAWRAPRPGRKPYL